METFNEMGSFDKTRDEINEWTTPWISKNEIKPQELNKINEGCAIEQHQWVNYKHLSEMTPNKDTKVLFSQISFEEEEHEAKLFSLFDPDTTPMQSGLGQEMATVSAFAGNAQLEENQNLREAYNYILFDHLTQLKELSDRAASVGTVPDSVLQGYVQPMMGRPFDRQFISTNDLFKPEVNLTPTNVYSLAKLHGLIAAEEMLHNSFQGMRAFLPSEDIRRFYNMITGVETLHTTMLGSFSDPSMTPLEYAMINELAEVRIHRLGLQMSDNKYAKQAHEYAYGEDMKHLKMLQDAYSKEGGDPSMFDIDNSMFAAPSTSVNDYCNQIMNSQKSMTSRGMGFEKAA
jgi:rubrerythrin